MTERKRRSDFGKKHAKRAPKQRPEVLTPPQHRKPHILSSIVTAALQADPAALWGAVYDAFGMTFTAEQEAGCRRAGDVALLIAATAKEGDAHGERTPRPD